MTSTRHINDAGSIRVRPAESDALSRNEIGGAYAAFMEEVKLRLEAVAHKLQRLNAEELVNGWLEAEFCYLQLRRVCELTSLAVAIAHNQLPKFRTNAILKQWNADAMVERLLSLSPEAFPKAITIHIDHNGPGNHHIEPLAREVGPRDLKAIYRSCGDRLHTGSLKRILAGKRPSYQIKELTSWNNKLMRLLGSHMIMLPEIRSVVVVVLRNSDDGKVHCLMADAVEWEEEPGVSVRGKFEIQS